MHRNRRKRGLLGVLLAAVLTIAGSGCSLADYTGSTDVLRIGTDSGPDSLNPFVAQAADSYSCFLEMYPYLVQYGRRLQIIPEFARSWTVSPDGKVWTFHTVPRAEWSDGRPLTAEDAAWTLSTIVKFQNGATAASSTTVAHMVSAVAPNPDTLVITYDKPVANVLSQLEQIPILPEHVWARYAQGKGNGLKLFANPAPAVSGGPFQLVKYVHGEIALFQRNPHWFGARPHIRGFGLETFQDDDSMIQSLVTHQLDAVEVVPPTAIANVRRDHFEVAAVPGLNTNYFSINDNVHMTGHRELLDPVVRRAINVAINRQEIDRIAYLGYAQPGGNVIAPADGSWYDAAVAPPAYDPALADRLLDQAGFRRGPGGVRVADGHAMAFDMVLYPDGGPELRIFQIIEANLAAIGIKVTGQSMDTNAAVLAVYGPKNNYPSFQLQLSEWEPEVDPDFQLSVFLRSQWGGWNDSGFDDPAYDHLYAEQGTAIQPAARKAIIYRMQELLARKLPYVVIDYPEWVAAWDRHWSGFVMNGQGFFNALSNLTLLDVRRSGG